MLNVLCIPAFDDNYLWLITSVDNQYCAVVDPGDADPVLSKLNELNLKLSAILITHKHYDHVGGVEDLKQQFPEAVVYGPVNEGIKHIDINVGEGDKVDLTKLGLTFDVIEVPGHTEGHIAYFGYGALFCGDTLFAGGCGRVFSGTFEQLSVSLKKISLLPPETLVYCAHEYTLANLGFAKWVEPNNQLLIQRQIEEKRKRDDDLATVPSLLQVELNTNPFLRVKEDNVIAAARKWANRELNSDADVFTALRQWKDRDYD